MMQYLNHFSRHSSPINSRAYHYSGRQSFERPQLLNGLSYRVIEGIIGSVRQYRTFWGRSRPHVTSMWRRYRKTCFSRRLGKTSCVHSSSHTAQTKHVGNKLSAYKMSVKTLPLQWWSKTLKRVLVGVQVGKKHGFRGYFKDQATFLLASNHQPHQTYIKGVFGCFTTSHQISSQNIGRKILFLKKSISTRCPSSFHDLFLALTP